MLVHLVDRLKTLDYKELTVWRKSRELVSELYEMTKAFPKEEKYNLTGQIRRAAISVPSNIAEGCGRHTSKETLRFLFIARGSLYELETHLYLALDQALINTARFDMIDAKVKESMQLLSGFIRYFRNRT